jgi:hypothetical protein
MLGIYLTQRMEPWWRHPDTFDPERFRHAHCEDTTRKYTWAPFGGGVHKCTGMHFGSMGLKRSCTSRCCATPGGYLPATSLSSTTEPAHSLATASQSSYRHCTGSSSSTSKDAPRSRRLLTLRHTVS